MIGRYTTRADARRQWDHKRDPAGAGPRTSGGVTPEAADTGALCKIGGAAGRPASAMLGGAFRECRSNVRRAVGAAFGLDADGRVAFGAVAAGDGLGGGG